MSAVSMLFALLITAQTAVTPVPPRIAIIAERNTQAERILVSGIQAILADTFTVVDRQSLPILADESMLSSRPIRSLDVDYLIMVHVEATRIKSASWLSFFGPAEDCEVLTRVKIINPRTAQLMKSIVRRDVASLTELHPDLGPAKVTRVQLNIPITVRPGKRLSIIFNRLQADISTMILNWPRHCGAI